VESAVAAKYGVEGRAFRKCGRSFSLSPLEALPNISSACSMLYVERKWELLLGKFNFISVGPAFSHYSIEKTTPHFSFM
jgi:hypothetical protein